MTAKKGTRWPVEVPPMTNPRAELNSSLVAAQLDLIAEDVDSAERHILRALFALYEMRPRRVALRLVDDLDDLRRGTTGEGG